MGPFNPGHMPYTAEIRTVIDRFHDVHHAFPNALGTLSQRGRFHGWKKVHDASVCCRSSKPPSLSFCWMFVWGSLYSKSTGTSELKNEDKRTMFGEKTFSTHDFHAYIALGLNHD